MIKKRLLKKCVTVLAAANIVALSAALGILAAFSPIDSSPAKAAVLDVEILSNITSANDSTTSSADRWADDGSANNVNFTISGGELVGASTVFSGEKQAVLSIPTELQGNVVVNGPATVNTNVTVPLDQIAFLTTTLDAVDALVTQLTDIASGSLGSLTDININLTDVQQKLDVVKNIENLGAASFTSSATVSGGGTYISAPISDGLGLVIAQNLSDALNDLNDSINALQATVTNPLNVPAATVAGLINTTLLPLKGAATLGIQGVLPLIQVGGSGVNQLADASVLGATTVSIPTTINSPTNLSGNLDAKFVGTVIQSDLIDINLINTANGVSYVYYAGAAAAVTPPTVDSVTGNSTAGYTVTGTGTTGDTILIQDADGNTIGTGTVDGDGNYTVTLPAGSAGAEEQLNAIAENSNGGQSAPTPFTTPADDIVLPTTPTVDNVTGNSTDGYTVTGTGVTGETILIQDAEGNTIGTGTVDGDGNYTVTLPAGSAGAEEQLNAIAENSNGDQSAPTPFTTPADGVVLPTSPTVDNVTGNSTAGYTITGTGTTGDTILIQDAEGNTIGTGTVDGDGNYTVTLPAGSAGAEEQLNAIAENSNGDQSAPTPFTTPADGVVLPTSPTVDTVTGNSMDGYTVAGTGTIGETILIQDADGNTIGTGTVDGDGNYTVTLPAGSAGAEEQLNAIAENSNGDQSAPTPFTTPADSVALPTSPIVDEVTGNSVDGYTVTGTGTVGNTILIQNADGLTIGTGTVDGDGNYTVTLPAGSAGAEESLNAIAENGNGDQSAPTPFMTPADVVVLPTSPTVDSVTGNSADGYTVTGTGTTGDTILIQDADGNTIGTGTVDGDGNYTVTLPAGSAGAEESLNAIAENSNGDQSAPTPFMTPADAVVLPTSPTVDSVVGNSMDGYTVTGTGTTGDTILIQDADGNTIGTGTVDGDGNYTVTLPAGSAEAEESLNAIAENSNGDQSAPTPFTTPADSTVLPMSPIVDTVTGNSTDGYTVTGMGTAGNTILIQNAEGLTIGTGIVDEEGNYTVTLPAGSAGAEESLNAIAENSNGDQSTPTPFTTPADPITEPIKPDAPTVTSVMGNSTSGYTVRGASTFGNTVIIQDADENTLGTATVEEDGDYTVVLAAGSASAEEQLNAIAENSEGVQSDPTVFATPQDPIAEPEQPTAPTVGSVTGNSTDGYVVSGTGTPGDTILIQDADGNTIGTGTVDEDGNYTVTLPAGSAGPEETLTAIAENSEGVQSEPTSFTTPADPVTAPIPTGTDNNSGNNPTTMSPNTSTPLGSSNVISSSDQANYSQSSALPKTGDTDSDTFLLSGLLLSLIGGSLLVLRRKSFK
ncbi:Ig-like domain-containing protein [Listeria ilorinensis]|uniref:Ig-like domain-containing protein n=1 Tax=Listeria ilorinensis TaxID=2867439 RepID=UPI001EF65261|nr:Ig-like domain-containing protein [Listeria ilorinensis]